MHGAEVMSASLTHSCSCGRAVSCTRHGGAHKESLSNLITSCTIPILWKKKKKYLIQNSHDGFRKYLDISDTRSKSFNIEQLTVWSRLLYAWGKWCRNQHLFVNRDFGDHRSVCVFNKDFQGVSGSGVWPQWFAWEKIPLPRMEVHMNCKRKEGNMADYQRKVQKHDLWLKEIILMMFSNWYYFPKKKKKRHFVLRQKLWGTVQQNFDRNRSKVSKFLV